MDERRTWRRNAGSPTVIGSKLTARSARSHIRLLATPAIRPDCVYLTPGYGHLSRGLTTAFGIGASDSVLHVTYTDPASGSQALSQTFVTVRKA